MLPITGCVLEATDGQPSEMLDGTVVDAMTSAPIAGAMVRVDGVRPEAEADSAGRFSVALPHGARGVVISAAGYFALTRGDLDTGASGEPRLYELYRESPTDALVEALLEGRTDARSLRDTADDPALRPDVRAFLRGELEESALRGRSALSAGDDVAGARAALSAPPETVRIWRRSIDGASASCSGRIDVIPLEDYVKGVLPREWIASWQQESLRAGALAIRTYVWNWVLRGGKYDCADLDDTTRSQVYGDDRMAPTNDAVDATRGEGIARGGSLVSGEYSAENGDPTADGVSDALCAGRAVYGHGRGMCQWGSQRWAVDGRDHAWIATHYWPGSTVEGGAPAVPDFGAELVGMDHPAEMVAGERAEAWVELRNTGAHAWDGDTRLGTTQPNDHASPFYDATGWIGPDEWRAPTSRRTRRGASAASRSPSRRRRSSATPWSRTRSGSSRSS